MTETVATVRVCKQRGKMEYHYPFVTYFCLLEMQLYLRCAESYFIWLGNQWGWYFRNTVHHNFCAGKHMAWMNINHSPDLGMINVCAEDATDTYSKNCVTPPQLFTCFFSLALWICNYFMFKYTKASLLKVVSSACLALPKAAASLIIACDSEAPHHRTCAWKHGTSISCVKLYFSGLGLCTLLKVGINVSERVGRAFC